MSGVSSPVYGSGYGYGYGSSLPSRVDYAYIVAKAKVGLDAAITGPTSWAFRMPMGTASSGISTDTQLNGCIYMRTGGVLVAKYSDDTDACTYTVTGGWAATDELIIVFYVNRSTVQLGIIDTGAYSWGTAVDLVYPKLFPGWDSGTIAFPYTAPSGYSCWISGYNAAIDPGWDGDVGWDGPLDGRAKPRSLFSGSSDAWFESDGEQIALSNTTIAALPGINLEKGTKFFDTDTNIGYLEYSEKLPKAVEKTVFYAMGIDHHDYELLWNYTDGIASDVGADATVVLAGSTWAGGSTVLPVYEDYGVGVFPQYTQMFLNSGLVGGVSGDGLSTTLPENSFVIPTSWSSGGGNLGTVRNVVFAGKKMTITMVGCSFYISQNINFLANSTYYIEFDVTLLSATAVGLIVFSRFGASLPSGAVQTTYVNGIEINTSTFLFQPNVKNHVSIKLVFSTTGITMSTRLGLGTSSSATNGSCEIENISTNTTGNDVPHLVSPATSTATSVSTIGSATNGVSFNLDTENIDALAGICTIAALFTPVGSDSTYTSSQNILTTSASATQGIMISSGGVLSVSDGANTASVTIGGGFSKHQKIAVALRVNANNTIQAGYCKVATETTFTWGAAATYAGSVAQTGKAILGYGATIPFYVGSVVIWAKTANDAEILLGMEKALA